MALSVLAGRTITPTPFYSIIFGGTSDDRAAIQTQIDLANTAYASDGIPRTIRLRGKFTLPQTSAPAPVFPDAGYGRRCAIAIRPGVSLYAERDALFTATQADLECFITALDTGVSFANGSLMGGSDWSVKGIVFDCNQTSGAEFNGGVFSLGGATNDWEIRNCLFKRIRGDAVTIIGSNTASASRWRFTDNEVRQMAGQTILAQIVGPPMTNFSVRNVQTRNGTTTAETYAINGSATTIGTDVEFTNVRIEQSANVVLAKCQDVTIDNLRMVQPSDTQGACLDISGCNGVTITNPLLDSSAAATSGANHPIYASTGATNVTISGGVLKCGYAGMKGSGTDWTVDGTIITTVSGSTAAATATALNLSGVTGASVKNVRIKGAGAFNCISVGDNSTISDCDLPINGYITAGNDSRVHDNRLPGAPLNGAGPQTYSAIGVGSRCHVHHNEVSAGTSSGAITASSESIIEANRIENTYNGGYYVFANSTRTFCLDNMGIATQPLGTFGGNSDGFVCGGTGSVKRLL
jgi:hypothetical protein